VHLYIFLIEKILRAHYKNLHQSLELYNVWSFCNYLRHLLKRLTTSKIDVFHILFQQYNPNQLSILCQTNKALNHLLVLRIIQIIQRYCCKTHFSLVMETLWYFSLKLVRVVAGSFIVTTFVCKFDFGTIGCKMMELMLKPLLVLHNERIIEL
jgi:hypothetical protein